MTTKRAYNGESRKLKAKATRKRILDAAKSLFETEGFEPVTIEKIAKMANVSAPTVYLIFLSKRGILRAIMDDALPVDSFNALVEAEKNESSPTKRLELSAKIARSIYDAERSEMSLTHGVALLAPEFKEQEADKETRRYQRQEENIAHLFTNKQLKATLSLAQARDIAWAFTGRDLYRMLVLDRGWSSDAYEKWLAETLINALL
ncbi:MAG: TetR/AcrR family transcriptional regulator [Verrucomicrobia bacterium]|nr:TetR/AcrR family transcriptional regulator [Verrucomicrobiota bacterium]MBS0637772.1 TetR/AcrR family transcriptional regulator [Verrucomicrobiota bacterium]